MFDVCVVGHVTLDIIRIDEKVEKELPGGTAYYTSIALNSLGLNVAVVTKTARKDRDYLLAELQARGITVFWQGSEQTSVFEEIYQRENLDLRVEKVWAIADPFSPKDIAGINTRVFHIGPLTNQDLESDFLASVAQNPPFISLDAQGLIRKVTESGEVKNVSWKEKETGLSYVNILKADERETRILSGEDDVKKSALLFNRLGVKEVIITFGSKGSLIYSQGNFTSIPAFVPRQTVDATGCGDTYVAGYLFQRLNDAPVEKAGRFAAAVATRKLENFGPLIGCFTRFWWI